MPESSDLAVSIVLPSYNRARFLHEAFDAIRAQTLTNWELIVVDDGGSDDTRAVVGDLSARCAQRVRYHYQANQGPGGARNTGVDLASAQYVAFFDSDDLWLPHHLADCVAALESSPEVDWVYGSCQVVDLGTGSELQPSSFYPKSRSHPFLSLSTRQMGPLRVITDSRATECMIAHGLMCGLQCSVMRRRIFETVRLRSPRTVHDQIFVVEVLKAGLTLAYFDKVHTIYRIHDECVSARGDGAQDKAIGVLHELVQAWEEIPQHVTLNARERRALRRRLADEWFWTLGYSLLWQNGRRIEAMDAFREGLRRYPWDGRLWKTYAGAVVRRALSFQS